MRELKIDQVKRVVVRGPNWLGDVVMSVPALRQLRRLLPNARITLVSRPGTADVCGDADFVDEILLYDRSGLSSARNQVREWRRRKFDLALIFQNAFDAAAIAWFARVPLRVGYDADRRRALLTHPIPRPAWKDERHESFYYQKLVTELGRLLHATTAAEAAEPDFALVVSADRKRQATAFLSDEGLTLDTPLVLLCPGSINSRAKRWPAERYGALADLLLGSGVKVALIGSPQELDVSRQVCRHAHHELIVLTGKTTIAEATAIVSVADVLITNDTGPAHIGSAVGTPTLVIFGPTNPLTTYPYSPSAKIIRHPPDCAPCMLRDCPIDHRCMTAISPEEVFKQAQVLISRQRAKVTA